MYVRRTQQSAACSCSGINRCCNVPSPLHAVSIAAIVPSWPSSYDAAKQQVLRSGITGGDNVWAHALSSACSGFVASGAHFNGARFNGAGLGACQDCICSGSSCVRLLSTGGVTQVAVWPKPPFPLLCSQWSARLLTWSRRGS